MFWDGIGEASIFQSELWPDSVVLAKNHLFIEPQTRFGGMSNPPEAQENGYWQLGLLNSIVYKNIEVRQTLNVDKRFEYDSAYPAHKDRGMRGRIEEAFLNVTWKYGGFRLGRFQHNWGPFADRSLILSANPYTYDAFEWKVHASFFEFRHLFAAFPTEKSYWDTHGKKVTNRYFTAHALNVMLGKWATIGVLESVVFPRDQGMPDLAYINPFSIYSVINTNQEGSGNLMIGVQWNVHPLTENISFRGQIVWDDFQVDNELVTDKEPTHWGGDFGLYFSNLIPVSLKNSLKLEYNYRSEWLYTVPDANTSNGERYTYLTKSLGFAENDGYRVGAGGTVIGKKYWAASLNAAYELKGPKDITSKWNDLAHIPGLPFDSTVLPDQKKISIGIDALGYFKDYANLKVGINAAWLKNEHNMRTEKFEFKPSVNAELSIHFSNFVIRFPD